jgi:hypothetical protein
VATVLCLRLGEPTGAPASPRQQNAADGASPIGSRSVAAREGRSETSRRQWLSLVASKRQSASRCAPHRRTRAAARSPSGWASPRRARCARSSASATATGQRRRRDARGGLEGLKRREPAAHGGADALAVGLEPVGAADHGDLAQAGRRRHAEAVALALDHEDGHGHAVALLLARFARRRDEREGEAEDAHGADRLRGGHATRAPDERPPVTTGRRARGPARSCSTAGIHAWSRRWAAGVDRRPAGAPASGRAGCEPRARPQR